MTRFFMVFLLALALAQTPSSLIAQDIQLASGGYPNPQPYNPQPNRCPAPGGPYPPRQAPIQCAQPRQGDRPAYVCQIRVDCDHQRCRAYCPSVYNSCDVRPYSQCNTRCDQQYYAARNACPR